MDPTDPYQPSSGSTGPGWGGIGGSSGGDVGPYGPVPSGLGGRAGRPRRRRRIGCLGSLVLAIVVLIAVYTLPNPWALHIGGRFTPLESWQGLGAVTASNGGHYELYVSFSAGLLNGGEHGHSACSGTGGCDELSGTARLCTASGKTWTFRLTGDVETWWATDGAAARVDLTNSPPLPDGWVVAFHGNWRGPGLVLSSPDNSFTEVFTRQGDIRSVTSTADAGTAHVTLAYGGPDAFTAACAALR
jgi:hypothetical protein